MKGVYSIKDLRRAYTQLPIGLKMPQDASATERELLRRALNRDIYADMTAGELAVIRKFIAHFEWITTADAD